jgi:hypothetical protein
MVCMGEAGLKLPLNALQRRRGQAGDLLESGNP